MEISDQINWGEALDSIFLTPDETRSHTLFNLLVTDIIKRNARSGIISTFRKGKVLDRNSKGVPVELSLDEYHSKYGGTDHDALKMIATDVSQKAHFAISNLYKNNHRKRVEKIKIDLSAYLLEHYLEPLKNGKRTISDIFYWRNTSLRQNKLSQDAGSMNFNDDYPLQIAAAAGENPEDLLSLASARRILSQITSALQEALSELFRNFRDSFNYLIALIESSLLVRETQANKPKSKRTSTVQKDLSAIFFNALHKLNEYSNDRYSLVYSGGYDPFEQLGCGGVSPDSRMERFKNKAKLLKIFRPLLKRCLKPCFKKKDVVTITEALCTWVENVKYKNVAS